MAQRLYRSEDDRVIAGLCGGLGEFFDIDPTIIRIIFVILTIWGGIGIILYIIGALVVPINPAGASGEHKGDREEFNQKVNVVASEIKENIRRRRGDRWGSEKLLGILILVAGAVLLLQEIFPNNIHNIFWPAILILCGVLILTGGSRKGGK